MLADALAAAGFPTLRFDYPGTGDSLGEPQDVGSLETLKASVRRAAEELRLLTNGRGIVLIGQGLGASIAAAVSPEVDAEGLALLLQRAKVRGQMAVRPGERPGQ